MGTNIGVLTLLAVLSLVCMAGVVYPFKPFRRRWIAWISFLVCAVFIRVFLLETKTNAITTNVSASSEGEIRYWVTSERLNRRTCSSQDCGIVGQFFFREGMQIYERKNGWARITKYYDASCVRGKSEYVDSGNASCDSSNGIVDGKFAEWVPAKLLSIDRPADPAIGASGVEKIIARSDDFARYRSQFAEARGID